MMKPELRLVTFFFLAILLSCTKDAKISVLTRPADCDSVRFTYIDDIKPIFTFNCNFPDCHADGGRGSYDYLHYEVIADRIRLGRLEDRLDLPVSEFQHMPPGRNLSPCDYFKLKTWIHQGFPDH